MRAINHHLLFLLLGLGGSFCASLTVAQNMTSSPYSMFGIGEPAEGLYGQLAGMGGVSYGMRGKNLLNSNNPAAFTALDSCHLIGEASVFAKYEEYASRGETSRSGQGNFARFTLGGRVLKRWYMGAGVLPYSSVGYYFITKEPMEGTDGGSVTSQFEGSGGLSKVYWTHAFLLSPRWSVGMNLSYIFGNLVYTETQGSMAETRRLWAGSLYADFGLQYTTQVNKHTSFTWGAVYGYRQKLKFTNEVSVTGESVSSSETKRRVTQYLPEFYGLGGSLHYKKMYYALDYSVDRYSVLPSSDSRVKFRDRHQLRAGVSYVPNSYISDKYRRRMEYKAGLSVSTPYMMVSGEKGKNCTATVGVDFPVRDGKIGVSLFYDKTWYGQNVLTKNLAGFTLTYTLSEKFYRKKLD